MIDYRIRWSRVPDRFGRLLRCCRAERRLKLLGLIPLWVPVHNAGWHRSEVKAHHDMDYDIELRQPLPETMYVQRYEADDIEQAR